MKKILKIALVIILGLLFIIGCGDGGGANDNNLTYQIEAPLITSSDKVSVLANEYRVLQVKATDRSNVRFYIMGDDEQYFNINRISGWITIKDSTKIKNAVYHIIAVVRDSVDNETQQPITITITDKPVFTSKDLIELKKNQIEVVKLSTKSMSSVVYSLAKKDMNLFTLDFNSNTISFKDMPDYNKKISYEITVKATDEESRSSTQIIKIIFENLKRDNIEEVVIDSSLKLMWQDDSKVKSVKKTWLNSSNYESCYDNNSSCFDTVGDTASTYCSRLTLADYSNWRLPTIEELNSIFDKTLENPPYIKSIFINLAVDIDYADRNESIFWSSTTYEIESYIFMADVKNFYGREVSASSKNSKYYVRCVRNINEN